MKRVVIDARWIGSAPSGVGVYTTELLRRLPALAPTWDFHALFAAQETADRVLPPAERPDNVATEVLAYGVFSPESQLLLPSRLKRLPCDLFHTTNYMMPYMAFRRGGRPGRGGRCVVTIHDAIPLLLPDHAPRSRKTRMLPLFRLCLRMSVERAAAVITVSQASRRDIATALRLGPEAANRVHAIHNGVGDAFGPGRRTRPPAGIRTLLYVGRLDPYKNVVTLVRAFALLRRQAVQPLHLLIVGPEDSRYPEARQTAESLGLQDAVTFVGFVTDEQLVTAYQEADVLVNPSAYEGFGLPLVEAMRCGVPVVCGDGGSQAEIVGEAGMVVRPGSAHALADAVQQVLTNDALRRRLIAAGLERARTFSWNRTATETLALYRQVLGDAP